MRVSRTERRLLDAHAAAQDLSLSDFVRVSLRAALADPDVAGAPRPSSPAEESGES